MIFKKSFNRFRAVSFVLRRRSSNPKNGVCLSEQASTQSFIQDLEYSAYTHTNRGINFRLWLSKYNRKIQVAYWFRNQGN